jgi:hypothetical protein
MSVIPTIQTQRQQPVALTQPASHAPRSHSSIALLAAQK